MDTTSARFSVGEIIHHRLFEYRGVIIDVDPHFLGTEEWYSKAAGSRPPKDRPWYHVLVDELGHSTYVAERNLQPDTEGGPVKHAKIVEHFEGMSGNRYIPRRLEN